ncbi:MAG: NAD-dependent epimerase/dehydratase family protein, partial [bacterium]|nr:NAD-dependent epimerase/dehydratase family protein [bacterium]
SRAKFYQADIRDENKIRKIFSHEKPDMINHHAAIAEIAKSLRDPMPTIEVNVQGTINLLLRGGEAHIKKFIFASTGGAIYGEPKKNPASELFSEEPLSPYGLSKLFGERAVHFYAKYFGFDYFIFRYANVYGPRQNPKGEAGVVAIFSALMKAGRRPTIFGDGSKARDYVHVKDIARANVLALKRGKHDTVNIGWGRKVTDKNIFDALAGGLHFKEKPIYAEFRKGEVYQISLSAKKAEKVLGFKPRLDFESGISEYLKGSA